LYRNHVWSYDFLVDRTEAGRQLKLLVVIDEFTRECLAAEVGWTFTARDVMLTLQYLFAVRGAPEHVRSDKGRHCPISVLVKNFFDFLAGPFIHFPIHARSSPAIIPSTTATHVVAMNRLRSVNRTGRLSCRIIGYDPASSNINQNGIAAFMELAVRRTSNPRQSRTVRSTHSPGPNRNFHCQRF
jgi:hypothetical protein